jgi:hypothetical protein
MQPKTIPDNTAVRVALWRALHLQVDAPPHIFEDELGLQLAAIECRTNSCCHYLAAISRAAAVPMAGRLFQ